MNSRYLFFAVLHLIFTFSSGGNTPRVPRFSRRYPIPGAIGPESLAFDRITNGPYTGVSDGRIIKLVNLTQKRWVNFAVTTPNRTGCEGPVINHVLTEARCGRPLGLSFNYKTRQLYVADAYKGLLVVGPKGGVATPLATQANGIPFRFLNGVQFDESRDVVYCTDSSAVFPRSAFPLVLATRDNTGRLLKFDTKTNVVTVLAKGLFFPNGVALSINGDFLLVAETTNARVLRYWLTSSKAGTIELFATVPGMPDNIRRNKKGEFLVALAPIPGNQYSTSLGLAVRLDENGRIIEVIQDKTGATWKNASELDEENGFLWIGSVTEPAVVQLKY